MRFFPGLWGACLGFLMGALASFSLTAQDLRPDENVDIDSLFGVFEDRGQSGEGTPVQDQEKNQIDSLEELIPGLVQKEGAGTGNALDLFTRSSKIEFFGNFSASVGYSLGWLTRPDLDDLSAGFEELALLGLTSTLGFDARPSEEFRIRGSVYTEYPGFALKISELFADYTIDNTLFTRVGRFGLSWGYSQHYDADDLPIRVPSGVNNDGVDDADQIGLKLTLPLGNSSLTGLVLAKNGYFANPSSPSGNEIGLGFLAETVVEKTEFSLSVLAQQHLFLLGVLGVKTSFLGIDFFAEGVAAWDRADVFRISALAGALTEISEIDLTLWTEYFYNSEYAELDKNLNYSTDPPGHNLTFGFKFKRIGGSKLSAGLLLQHVFFDNSGLVTPGIAYDFNDNLSIALGVPLIYGPLDSEAMKLNEDPLDRKFMSAIKLTLSGSFK